MIQISLHFTLMTSNFSIKRMKRAIISQLSPQLFLVWTQHITWAWPLVISCWQKLRRQWKSQSIWWLIKTIIKLVGKDYLRNFRFLKHIKTSFKFKFWVKIKTFIKNGKVMLSQRLEDLYFLLKKLTKISIAT